jgi:ADP-ribose pyrophosphatase YjhB (NUDIX family)
VRVEVGSTRSPPRSIKKLNSLPSHSIQRGLVTSEAPLYERDPAAWEAYLAEGNANQARKRVGADVILRDGAGRLLLVDPRYKPDWDLPGGMAEANEPPHEAARRELGEELGLDLRVIEPLCVEWVPPHGPWDDSLMFIFNGGELSRSTVSRSLTASWPNSGSAPRPKHRGCCGRTCGGESRRLSMG